MITGFGRILVHR